MANQIDATPNEMKNEFGLAMPRLASCRHTHHTPSTMNRNPETCARRGKNNPAAASSASSPLYAVAFDVNISGLTGSL
jgi:hypothetical protein